MLTAHGEQPISAVAVGESVLAYNEATGTTGVYTVTAAFSHLDPVVVELTLGGETIETTPEHPFYVLLRGWVKAGDLSPGLAVRQADGAYGVVEQVALVPRSQRMYNLTVAEAHTFFVGDEAWLVHNACPLGGYRRWDVGPHGDLKDTDVYPAGNRAPGNSPSLVDNRIYSHHIVQDQWAVAQRLAGRPEFAHYRSDDAIAILLQSSRGLEHSIISGRQAIARNQRIRQGIGAWGSSYAEELNSAYLNLRAGGIPHNVAWNAVKEAHKYFLNIGVPTEYFRP